MVHLAVSVEGVGGLTWQRWRRLVGTVEDVGFSALYLADHFVPPVPPDQASLELIVGLTYLADHTERVRFGSMVAPLSVRDPVMLARQAAALADLSGGRMELGVGAGWMEREHAMFGYDLGDVTSRFARFEEGLEVITRLLRSHQPVSFDGQFFRLHEATLPPPRPPEGPPITIGGSGPKRTLPLVARFADIWNAQGVDVEQYRERSALLDGMLEQAGRRPEAVRRTLNAPILCWRTPQELESRRRLLGWDSMSTEELVAAFKGEPPGFVGSPEEIVAHMKAFEAAGVSEISLQWFAADDIEGLEILATEILPLAA